MGTESQHKAWNESWIHVVDTIAEPNGWLLLDSIKLERLMSILPKNGQVLEVGCGSARLSVFLAERGYVITGLDYSMSALEVAQRNFEGMGLASRLVGNNEELLLDNDQNVNIHRFVQGDATKLPFNDNTFDIVISTGLLEHFEDPSIVVKEMVRVLASNGVFYSDVVPKKFSMFRLSKLWRPFEVGGESVYEGAYREKNISQWLDSTTQLEDYSIIPAGVLPPYRFTSRPKWLRKAIFALRPLWVWLEGGWLASVFGCYYFVTARKK